jgi:long-chain acyl-CoA synthetase
LADLLYNSYPLPTGAEENIKPGLEYTGRLLDHGWSVLIFPEGQMNRGGTSLQPLKTGAGMLAMEMQVPVVPVALIGTERILPPDLLLPRRRGVVQVRFGAPVRVDAGASYTAAAQHIEDALADLLKGSA